MDSIVLAIVLAIVQHQTPVACTLKSYCIPVISNYSITLPITWCVCCRLSHIEEQIDNWKVNLSKYWIQFNWNYLFNLPSASRFPVISVSFNYSFRPNALKWINWNSNWLYYIIIFCYIWILNHNLMSIGFHKLFSAFIYDVWLNWIRCTCIWRSTRIMLALHKHYLIIIIMFDVHCYVCTHCD